MMKLKCIKNTRMKGIFNKRLVKLDGLTQDKKYFGFLLSDACGDITHTTPYFLIYNDQREWEKYNIEYFAPVEE